MKCVRTYLAVSAVIFSLTIASCSFLHDDRVVAKVGGNKLYYSEIMKAIPPGLSAEDSSALAAHYINDWALSLIMNSMAEQQLSQQEKDVSAEVEEYRRSLLRYRYEQHYIEERLDTSVTDDEIEAAYKDNPSLYKLSVPIFRGCYVRFRENKKVREDILRMLSSSDAEDRLGLDTLSVIEKFDSFGNTWVDVVTVARDFGMDYGSVLAARKGSIIEIVDEQGMDHIVYLNDYLSAGKVPPLEYCAAHIRESIVGRRKYALFRTLEQDLLSDARQKENFVIYENDEK